jgi:hypothetical protein
MCQSWYSVIGQSLDIVGFLTIAWEWYFGYKQLRAEIAEKIEIMLEKREADHEGRPYENTRGFELQWRHVQELYWQEWRWRGRVFFTGVVLVTLGFMFQLLGSWPHLFRSC